MGSFVYAPGVKVYIDTYKHGILDVSDDLINGGMQRRSDGVSQFQFNLNNARRKYDRVFMPNDRIVVMMKRITWLQVYTGYLNELPMFTSWPRVVPISTSCSLKRLQYFWWDPTIAASKLLVQNSLINDRTGGSAPDGGIKQVIINLLEEVVDWSGSRALKKPQLKGSKIHIGGIPRTWFDFAANLQAEIQANTDEAAAIARQLLADAGALGQVNGTTYNNGAPVAGNGSVPAGTYDGKTFNTEQVGNAGIIIATLSEIGATRRQIAQTLACAMQESSLIVLDKGDRAGPDSRGLYQQRDNGAWGSYSDRMNPRISTLNFYKVLKTKDKPGSTFGGPIQATQVSAHPSAYNKWEGAAFAMLAAYETTVPTLGTDPHFKGGAQPTTYASGTISGSSLAAFGQRLVASRQISYGHSTNGTEAVPKELDCSAFLRHCVYKTAGDLGGMPRKASDIFAWAVQKGGKKITVDEARNIPGAIIGVTSNGSASGITHLEISIGDGKCVGAHHSGKPASVINIPQGYFNYAVLLPGVMYGGAGSNGVNTSGGQAVHGSPRAADARAGVSATGGSTAGSSGRAISDAERRTNFGEPGSLAERTEVKTPWGITVRGIHIKIAGHFAAACEEASRTSTWVPAQMQCLPPNDASGLPRRPIRGRSEWSLHSYGLAFDIFDTMAPSDVWGPRHAPDAAFREAFKRHGFRLGADYKGRKDYPHIEWAAAPPDGTGVAYTAGDGTAAGGPPGPPLFIDAASAGTDVSVNAEGGAQASQGIPSLFGSAPWVNPDAWGNDEGSTVFRGIRALANDTAILEYIGNLCKSTMRSFCSAPNGDFIAWFPDYYGKWKTAAKMILEPIEVKDFTVTWSDEHMVTHQYVSGALGTGGESGSIIVNRDSGTVEAIEFMSRAAFSGIVTIEQPGVMSLLFGQQQSTEETTKFVQLIYERFGPRPNFQEIPYITGPQGEFFMACFLFMQGWAYQFNANIDITFMPELYPGMLIQFPMYNFQAYVTAVSHTFDFTTGFGTTINIAAPAKIKDDGDHLFGLPIGPGDGSSNPLKNKLDEPVGNANPTPAIKTTKTTIATPHRVGVRSIEGL